MRLAALTTFLLASLLALAATAGAATYTVDSTGTADDAVPGNGVCRTAGGVCTLRAAVREADAGAGSDRVVVPAGTYTLATTLPVQHPLDARGRRGRLDHDRRRRRDRPAADRGRDHACAASPCAAATTRAAAGSTSRAAPR